MDQIVKPARSISYQGSVPGDKSISHRAVMFGAIALGITEIVGFLQGADCLSTIDCFRRMGVAVDIQKTSVQVHGRGLRGLQAPSDILDVGNSGTTLRLISGILAGQNFACRITGDASIQKRPMNRVIYPLSMMGAQITGEKKSGYAPLTIIGSLLEGIHYQLPIASAQIKSAVLLAGLYAQGQTVVTETQFTRNHTEMMLKAFGADITVEDKNVCVKPVSELYAQKIQTPGDISSAAYLIVAAVILPNSEVLLRQIGCNETRIGLITAMKEMGADIEILDLRENGGEPVADIRARSSTLKGVRISGDIIPSMIDEIPIIAVAALFAEGETVIADVQELKVKESNRIRTMVTELSKMGAEIQETEDGMIIQGGRRLKGAVVESYYDHRVAMSLAIAALGAKGETVIQHSECVDVSFPQFFELLAI